MAGLLRVLAFLFLQVQQAAVLSGVLQMKKPEDFIALDPPWLGEQEKGILNTLRSRRKSKKNGPRSRRSPLHSFLRS